MKMRHRRLLWLGVLIVLLWGGATCNQQARKPALSGFSVEIPLGKSTSVWISTDGVWLVETELHRR